MVYFARWRVALTAFAFTLNALSLKCHAQAPQTMSFQGVQAGPTGLPKPDGSYTLVLSLHDAATADNLLWKEPAQAVQVVGGRGLFSTVLGASTAFGSLAFDKPYWLEVQVQGDPKPMAPRLPLMAAPYVIASPTASLSLPFIGTANVASPGAALRVTNSGTGTGVSAIAASNAAISGTSQDSAGLYGISKTSYGAYGQSDSWAGVWGQSSSSSGVVGVSATYAGVNGVSTSNWGVSGSSQTGVGVFGRSDKWEGVHGESGTDKGVYGGSSGWVGVWGHSDTGTGVRGESTTWVGVQGESTAFDGVQGVSHAADHAGAAGLNSAGGFGVYGSSTTGSGVYGTAANGAVGFLAGSSSGFTGGVVGIGPSSGDPGSSAGLIAFPGNPANWAAKFLGPVAVLGDLWVYGTKNFRIDDPLDPANKYLNHSCAEGPEALNIYSGTTTTDAGGAAVVTLPAYFEAINKDYRYQLTCIGQFAQAIVAEKIRHNRFTIRTDKPNVEVSWQVTGVRNDEYARTHPHPVEEMKPASQRGKIQSPVSRGQGT